MNTLLKAMQEENTHVLTENGGNTYSTTLSGLMDLFALGGAYRNRSDDDCINLFMKAFKEDKTYALKCLFYLRDIRGGKENVISSELLLNGLLIITRKLFAAI